MPSLPGGGAARVVIVANNAETLDGLQHYLATAGMMCTSTRNIDDPGVMQKATNVIILFPDDFPPAAVRAFVRQIREAKPKLLTLLVTREPGRFGEVAAPDGRSRPPIVLPKPVFGWAILDTIRAHCREKNIP